MGEGSRNCVFKEAWVWLRATVLPGGAGGRGLLDIAVLLWLSRYSSNPELASYHSALAQDLVLIPFCPLFRGCVHLPCSCLWLAGVSPFQNTSFGVTLLNR